MNKYISLSVTGPPARVQYINAGYIVTVEPVSPTETIIHVIDGNFMTVDHTSDATANRTMSDAIASALLEINGLGSQSVTTDVVLPTIAGVPITINSIVYT